MDTSDNTGQHHDAHHIQWQFVSLFCGCERFCFPTWSNVLLVTSFLSYLYERRYSTVSSSRSVREPPGVFSNHARRPPAESVHRYPRARALFQRFSFQTHLNALLTLSALVWFKVGLPKSFRQVLFASLECNGNHIHDLDILWPYCSHSFACCLRAAWWSDCSTAEHRWWAQQWARDRWSEGCSNCGFDTRRCRQKFSHVRHSIAASRECKCCI